MARSNLSTRMHMRRFNQTRGQRKWGRQRRYELESFVIQAVRPHVVKISTPAGAGTGFLNLYNFDRTWIAIATAAHVVSYADEWELPIEIWHPHTNKTVISAANRRVIFIDHRTDSAVMLMLKLDLQLPEVPIALLPMSEPCGLGVDVGWLGFPAVEPSTLCFFSGAISARLPSRNAYLIDGVADQWRLWWPRFPYVTLR